MSLWFYRSGDQSVGPFERDVLEKIRSAGVIEDATLVRGDGEESWIPYAEAKAKINPSQEIRCDERTVFYLDRDGRTVGPVRAEVLKRLYDSGIVAAETSVAAHGDAEWSTVGRMLGLGNLPKSIPLLPTAADSSVPKYRSLEQFTLFMGATLSFYVLYLIPENSRDMKAITQRPPD